MKCSPTAPGAARLPPLCSMSPTGWPSGERLASTFPFELTVENGAITSGVFTIGFQVQASSPSGSGSGLLSIGGAFAGCGFVPQLKGLGLSFDGTMIIGESDIPVTFSNPIDGEGGLETVWLPNPITNPNTRTGALDVGGTMESIAAGGFSGQRSAVDLRGHPHGSSRAGMGGGSGRSAGRRQSGVFGRVQARHERPRLVERVRRLPLSVPDRRVGSE